MYREHVAVRLACCGGVFDDPIGPNRGSLRFSISAGCVTQMVVLERCGHGPMDEHPDQVLAAMTTFLNTHCFPTITTPKAATANSSSSRATAMPNQVSRGSGSVASPVPSAGHVGHGR